MNTVHTDDEDNRLYRILNIDIIGSDTDGDIIVGYRQHVFNNNKLDPTDTDIDVPYHINDFVNLTYSHNRVGLKATIINNSRHSSSRTVKYKMPPPYNIYSALRSCFIPPAQIIPDPDTPPEIEILLAHSLIDNTKLLPLKKISSLQIKNKLLRVLVLCENFID